jgi:4-alpha-glucanotransferase
MGVAVVVGPFSHRTAGVLLHPSSLPGREPTGTVGRDALRFVEWLATTGAAIWQILPLTINGRADSPYFSASSFAGNIWLIDLDGLRDAGLADADAVEAVLAPGALDGRIDFGHLYTVKWPVLWRAAERFLADRGHPWHTGYADWSDGADWALDVATFFAVKAAHGEAPWWEWPEPLRRHEPAAVAAARRELAVTIERWRALLYFFDRQWGEVRSHAHAHGVRLLGDLPIYVGRDAADVWAHQDQFHLDDSGHLLVQAGCPPDYFSETGQLWGNPLYRWDVMEADGYGWWLGRLRRCLELTDLVRIDHFRALSRYWEIPGDAETAVNGRWVDGPGQGFIDAARREFPTFPFVAEDLGVLDDGVYELRDRNALPGMRILQFGFDGTAENPHRPDRFPESCVVYTGTHDNAPVGAWWESLDEPQRADVAAYYHHAPDASREEAAASLVEAAYGSRAIAAVIPVQDWLALDMSGRMNDPSYEHGNWGWRMPADALTPGLAERMRELAARYGRA